MLDLVSLTEGWWLRRGRGPFFMFLGIYGPGWEFDQSRTHRQAKGDVVMYCDQIFHKLRLTSGPPTLHLTYLCTSLVGVRIFSTLPTRTFQLYSTLACRMIAFPRDFAPCLTNHKDRPSTRSTSAGAGNQSNQGISDTRPRRTRRQAPPPFPSLGTCRIPPCTFANKRV